MIRRSVENVIYTMVNPGVYIDPSKGLPKTGRGAWNRRGIDFSYRYEINPPTSSRIGTMAEHGLDYWATAAGARAVQDRLINLGLMAALGVTEAGIFGPRTQAAVLAFQRGHTNVITGAPLEVDGTVGMSDAKALFTPLIDIAEASFSIPNHYLRGECAKESILDPGAVGGDIYYPRADGGLDYRGIDRGMFQINSVANYQVTWIQAFDARYSALWSASRMRTYFNRFQADNPHQSLAVLWDAAICAHNNPAAATAWATSGTPSPAAYEYVNGKYGVKAAIY